MKISPLSIGILAFLLFASPMSMLSAANIPKKVVKVVKNCEGGEDALFYATKAFVHEELVKDSSRHGSLPKSLKGPVLRVVALRAHNDLLCEYEGYEIVEGFVQLEKVTVMANAVMAAGFEQDPDLPFYGFYGIFHIHFSRGGELLEPPSIITPWTRIEPFDILLTGTDPHWKPAWCELIWYTYPNEIQKYSCEPPQEKLPQ